MTAKRYLKRLEIEDGIILFSHTDRGRYSKYIDLWNRLRMFIFFAWTNQPENQRNLPGFIKEARKAWTLALTFDANFGQSESTATGSEGKNGDKAKHKSTRQ